jgi:hypothetical protein
MHHKESDKETPKSVLSKFQFFQGENDGQAILKQELVRLAALEKELGSEDGGEVCVPQRLLLLARQEETAANGESSKGE